MDNNKRPIAKNPLTGIRRKYRPNVYVVCYFSCFHNEERVGNDALWGRFLLHYRLVLLPKLLQKIPRPHTKSRWRFGQMLLKHQTGFCL